MPASQKVQLHSLGVSAEVEPVDTDRRLFFTDERPEFELTIHNEMDAKLDDESELRWGVGIGEGKPEAHIQDSVDVGEIPSNEARTVEIGGELLALEGHGVIALKAGGVSNPSGDVRSLSSNDLKENYEVPYTFSVWDRENYETVHERPVKYQRFSVFFAVVVAVLGLVQIGIVFL